jgi:hypothetical protein
MKQRFPQLFSYVLNEELFAKKVFDAEDISSLFYLPLSQIAYQKLLELKQMMQENSPSDQLDVWKYCWGDNYTPAQFYKLIHEHMKVPSVHKWLWKSCCMMKTKMFAWLLLSDRLNTRDLLQRRHVTDDTHCELCPGRIYEGRIHLFFHCNFSQRIWNYLQITWVENDNIQTTVNEAKRSFGKPFFMEVLITACWNIWLLRNGKIFRNERPTFGKWKA